MKKQTAVEWLIDELRNQIAEGTLNAIAISDLKMLAKVKEKEQIEDAYDEGHSDCFNGEHKQYYNETYK